MNGLGGAERADVSHTGSSAVRDALRGLAADALALLWPTYCRSCGAADRDFCDDCRAKLAEQQGRIVSVNCGVRVPVLAAGAYRDPLRAFIVGFKHEGLTSAVRPLARVLRAPLASGLRLASGPHLASRPRLGATPSRAGPPAIVPVPSRPQRVRERGYHHLEVLLRATLREMGASRRGLVVRALKVRRGRTGQVGLDAKQREENARRVALRRGYRAKLAGRGVVLFDDIVTTGATLRATLEALEKEGVPVCAIVTLAAVQKRSEME